MPDYDSVIRWNIRARVGAAWALLSNSEDWPSWWKASRGWNFWKQGHDGEVGLRCFEWKSRLPYLLTFDMRTTLVERPWRLEGQAEGEL